MAQSKEDIRLKAEARRVFGRKVKQLRNKGITPANIFGKQVKSEAVQLSQKEFLAVLAKAGETKIVNLEVSGEDKSRPVLIHNVQKHPVFEDIVHVDFYQVDLKEKIAANIPLELIGEPLAVKDKIGILIQPISEVEVEALPTDFPEKIEVDVSGLKAVDDAITVADLKVPSEIKVLTDPSQLVAKISALAEEVVAPAPAAEEVTAEGEKVAEEGEEAAADGGGAKEEGKEEKKEEKE